MDSSASWTAGELILAGVLGAGSAGGPPQGGHAHGGVLDAGSAGGPPKGGHAHGGVLDAGSAGGPPQGGHAHGGVLDAGCWPATRAPQVACHRVEHAAGGVLDAGSAGGPPQGGACAWRGAGKMTMRGTLAPLRQAICCYVTQDDGDEEDLDLGEETY
ncbi:hypothetical protein CYMTET_17264 [Cymbomonas tetramitiformis]|uniref:Uncharacterized protein n=1 Tax=Cymbomonas tetramitiformis TaxID=36881 RepID=A0AAE0GA86_9CHLO|nr:hypothetical protein CYMTET_17264 [Cymbomonas tetramitiformis]